jgi:hypothetical protein
VEALMERRPSIERPLWVKVALWGVPNRAVAWALFWLCVAVAPVFFVISFWNPFLVFFWFGTWDPIFFFLGVYFVLVALWYWLAIRWVDQHGGWS